MSTIEIRVLVAEDHGPFRRFLTSTIQDKTALKVVCEVADGTTAVQKAGQLQPELLLLDIGLPGLNGIEAARQIRALCPNCKILFVSQESSSDVVEAALDTGAIGYVAKTDAGRELIVALDSVSRGQSYLSRSIAEGRAAKSSPAPAGEHGRAAQPEPRGRHHEVGFYSDDRSFLDGFTNFVEPALRNGNAAIVMATESHRNKLMAGLQSCGLDIGAAMEEGRYVALDIAPALCPIMANNLPEPNQFYRFADDLIKRAARSVNGEIARVVACGECAPYLLAQGNAEAAIRLEHLWDEIARTHGMHILCGYPLACFRDKTGGDSFDRICAEHSAVISLRKTQV
ncbi:MAG TPA: response regulator [Candidatus Sulfotelmatobacter sp.]|nr:response regulator [Candidatus Sulfotelmatobacter sp.]